MRMIVSARRISTGKRASYRGMRSANHAVRGFVARVVDVNLNRKWVITSLVMVRIQVLM